MILTILEYVCSFATAMVLKGKNWLNPISSEIARFHTYFVATIFIFFIFCQFAPSANSYDQPCSLYKSLSFQAHHDQAKTFFQPFHGASKPATETPFTEFLSETGLEEKSFFDEDYDLRAGFSITKIGRLDSAKNLQLQFLRSLQNRPTLSLFVLHHSWKSFLS